MQRRRPRIVLRLLAWHPAPLTEGILFGAMMVLILFGPV